MANINDYTPAKPTTRLANYDESNVIDALYQILGTGGGGDTALLTEIATNTELTWVGIGATNTYLGNIQTATGSTDSKLTTTNAKLDTIHYDLVPINNTVYSILTVLDNLNKCQTGTKRQRVAITLTTTTPVLVAPKSGGNVIRVVNYIHNNKDATNSAYVQLTNNGATKIFFERRAGNQSLTTNSVCDNFGELGFQIEQNEDLYVQLSSAVPSGVTVYIDYYYQVYTTF